MNAVVAVSIDVQFFRDKDAAGKLGWAGKTLGMVNLFEHRSTPPLSRCSIVFCTLLTLALSLHAEASKVPRKRDRQVLAAALSSLLKEQDCNMSMTPALDSTVILEAGSPDNTGMIGTQQIGSDLDEDHVLSKDIEENLLLRNEKLGTNEPLAVSYTGIKFGPRIVVAKAAANFQRNHAKARAWVQAWLPGYSQDGKHAVVSAWLGPTAHAAVVTVLLDQHGGKWIPEWHYLAVFM